MKHRRKYAVSKLVINIVMGVLSALFVIPIIYVISISLTGEKDILLFGYRLVPPHIDLGAYRYIFASPGLILDAYKVTVLVTVMGVLLSLVITTMLSFAISRNDYRYRKITSFFIYFTMLFNGGLVPWYILISRYLHLKNSILVLIVPYLVNAWFVFLMKGFLKSIPAEIFESAKVDGAKEFRIFYRIVLPLSKPGLAAVGLFISLVYWNDWWLAMLFVDSQKLLPIQYMLNRIMSNLSFLQSELGRNVSINVVDFPNESARMAMCVLAMGPMLFAFPFFQRYFTKGLIVGSLKG